ncbi:MAG: 50S ribosomal protein L16 [Candidatus Micrarchaeota archaeon]
MALRPAKTCRQINKVAWTRYSRKKPKKSFVKAMPHNSLVIYKMGKINSAYDTKIDLVCSSPIQVRDNALESARQAVNKYLEKTIPENYQLFVQVYPHNVLRENKMILGAGADRLQKGMRKAYGRAMDRAARIYARQIVFSASTMSSNLPVIKEAYRRAKAKLPGSYRLKITQAKAVEIEVN